MWNERGKRWLQKAGLVAFGCLISIAGAESALSILPYVRHGTVGRSEKIEIRKAAREPVAEFADRWENVLVPHPLFGYVYNPQAPEANNFGFYSEYDITLADSGYAVSSVDNQKALIVGIFGGSFAQFTGQDVSKYLETQLAPLFPDRVPVVMNFAIAGHALPQSAYIFLYFREMFDIIVFLDGLNELWNPVDNNNAGTPPEYAKAVHYLFKLSLSELSPENFRHTNRILAASRNLRRLTDISLSPVLRHSVVGHHVWSAVASRLQTRIAEESHGIRANYERSARFFDADDNQIRDHAVRQWESHHALIHTISKSMGILDLHLVQPNPFVPDSKALTAAEAMAIESWTSLIREHVVVGYPHLRQALDRLEKNTGLIGEDLSFIFRNETNPVWADGAHANPLGSQRVADIILELIRTNRASLLSRSLPRV